jgi:hypothetical protein
MLRSEKRSLAFHRAIAERLADDGDVLVVARERVAEWLRTGAVHPTYAAAWQAIFAGDPRSVAAAIVAETEEACALRQVSPFAGVLSPRERWRLWRESA